MNERLGTDSSKVRILVIDDDFQVSETIRDFLVSKGFDVETAHNGKQGVHVLDLRIDSLRQRDRKAHVERV
jgi:DNA-binding response OmpR family regulator